MRRDVAFRLGLAVVAAVAVSGPAAADETYRFAWYQNNAPLGASASFTRDPAAVTPTVVTLQLYIVQEDLAAMTPAPNRPDVFNSVGLFGYGFSLNTGSNTSNALQVATAAALKSSTAFDDIDAKSLSGGAAEVIDKVQMTSPFVTVGAGVKAIRLADIDFSLVSDTAGTPFTLTAAPTAGGVVDGDINDLNDTLSGFATAAASLSVTVVPVPDPVGLVALATAGLLAVRWRSRAARP